MENDRVEYLALRQEINARAALLHQLLALGTVLIFAGSFGAFWLYNQSRDWDLTQNFLLTLPLVFSCLTLGYENNQWCLERVAHYLRRESPNKDLAANWESYFGKAKRNSELLSFLKVLPLLLPQLLPFILMWWNWGVPTSPLTSILTGVDIALLILVIFSFRYKLPSYKSH